MRFEEWLSQQDGVIEVDCGCVTTEAFYHWMRVAYESGNSPLIPEGCVMVPKEPTPEMLAVINEAIKSMRGSAATYARVLAAAPHDTPALNSLQSVDSVAGKWIPVSERMPDDNSDVLCTAEFDGPGDWRRKVGYWHEGKWVVYGASWTPTHWMPLPAAPQEVK